MAWSNADEHFNEARQRWPAVHWPRDRYIDHVADEQPTEPVDLFLGGAAGHRIKPAWEAIETDLAPNTKRILQRQPTADYTLDDLWADTIARLMEDEPSDAVVDLPGGGRPARIIKYRGKVKLLHYLVVVAKRLAIGRKRRRKPELTLDSPASEGKRQERPDRAAAAPDAAALEDEAIGKLAGALAAGLAELSDDQRALLRLVFCQGMAKKDAGAILGWADYKVAKQLKAVTDKLQAAMDELAEIAWTPALREAWGRLLRQELGE